MKIQCEDQVDIFYIRTSEAELYEVLAGVTISWTGSQMMLIVRRSYPPKQPLFSYTDLRWLAQIQT